MQPKKKKVGILRAIKDRIIGGVSTVLAAPAILKSNRIQRESGEDFRAMRAGSAIEGKTIEPYDHTNPDFRTRMNAIGAKLRTERRAKSIY